jgi:hypothetical protein
MTYAHGWLHLLAQFCLAFVVLFNAPGPFKAHSWPHFSPLLDLVSKHNPNFRNRGCFWGLWFCFDCFGWDGFEVRWEKWRCGAFQWGGSLFIHPSKLLSPYCVGEFGWLKSWVLRLGGANTNENPSAYGGLMWGFWGVVFGSFDTYWSWSAL